MAECFHGFKGNWRKLVKVIDISLIADRSLDIYCSELPKIENTAEYRCKGHVPKKVAASVGKIFSKVTENVMDQCCQKFDKVFLIVPCYPINRLKNGLVLTRLLCRNSDILAEMGVSSSHFLEFFEKFISLKCVNEYVTQLRENAYVLNARNALYGDWVEAIKNTYGSSLVDDTIEDEFKNNPNFIIDMGISNPEMMTETGEDLKYKLNEIVKSL